LKCTAASVTVTATATVTVITTTTTTTTSTTTTTTNNNNNTIINNYDAVGQQIFAVVKSASSCTKTPLCFVQFPLFAFRKQF